MTANREELRDQLSDILLSVYAAGEDNLDEPVIDNAAHFILSIIYDLFGGRSNFEAVLKLVEQTKGLCPECKGIAYFAGAVCPVCNGSGKGKIQIDRLVVRQKGDLYFSKEQRSSEDWAAKYYKD